MADVVQRPAFDGLTTLDDVFGADWWTPATGAWRGVLPTIPPRAFELLREYFG